MERSLPEQVLSQCVEALERWDKGYPYERAMLPGTSASRIAHSVLRTVFRRRASLDWILAQLTRKPVRSRLRRVLWCGLAQHTYMDGIHGAAVTDTCVRYVKRRFSRREADFVNAVLRECRRRQPNVHEQTDASVPPHVRCDLSPQLYRRWQPGLGPQQLRERAALLLTPAPLIARLRKGARRPPEKPYLARLPSPPWAPDAQLFVCSEPRVFLAAEEFQQGMFYVQDPSTLLAPQLLAPKPTERIADLCAAPGGKALILGESLGHEGALVCMDRSARRLTRLRENIDSLPRTACLLGDAATPPFAPAAFDGILLDVPCSNTGVIRRRPDVRWRFSETLLKELTKLQARILEAVSPLVVPGGRIVYSTCSIEPEENLAQITGFLARHPEFALIEDLQIFPAAYHDGGYAALLRNIPRP